MIAKLIVSPKIRNSLQGLLKQGYSVSQSSKVGQSSGAWRKKTILTKVWSSLVRGHVVLTDDCGQTVELLFKTQRIGVQSVCVLILGKQVRSPGVLSNSFGERGFFAVIVFLNTKHGGIYFTYCCFPGKRAQVKSYVSFYMVHDGGYNGIFAECYGNTQRKSGRKCF